MTRIISLVICALMIGLFVISRTASAPNGVPQNLAPVGLPASLPAGLEEEIKRVEAEIYKIFNDEAVLSVYTGPQGVFAHARPGSVIIEMSTVLPWTSRELHRLGLEAGVKFLDTPISGSTPAAKQGALTLFCGGDEETFQAAQPIFNAIARQNFYLGPSGSGATMKLVVNALLGVGMQAIADFEVKIRQDVERQVQLLVQRARVPFEFWSVRHNAPSQPSDLGIDFLQSFQLHIAVRSPVSSEEADHQRPFAQQVGRSHLRVILIEQGEARGTVPDFQRASFNAGSLKLGRGAMHRFDRLARRIIRRGSGFKSLLEFVQTILKI